LNIKIRIPNNNCAERNYIIDIFFSEFLNLQYELYYEERDDWSLELPDNKSIVFADAFFSKFDKECSYLDVNNIPEKISFAENQFTPEKEIPVLYGNNETQIFQKKIVCGIDIFASSFFMLSRWEEHVIVEKDYHDRTPDDVQLVFKHGIHYRPIVNEYLTMLKNMLIYYGVNIQMNRSYKLKLTHDIDFFARYDNFFKRLKAIGGDLFKRKSFQKAKSTLQHIKDIRKGIVKDPYDTFDYLMDLSEKAGVKSIFYFIPGKKGEDDVQYNIDEEEVVAVMNHIKERGHKIAVHGTYRSYKNKKLFKKELKRFPKNIKIKEVRQHYLRFHNPDTWQMHEDLGLKKDSSLGFMTDGGFRAGICHPYPLFNIISRKQLKIKQVPIVVMEQALAKAYNTKESFRNKIIELKETVQKYSGTFVVLWHNNNFHVDEWEGYKAIYENLVV
jgi:peptidoglycan/xylan/chitin deacetylase (PgdA/CDA1 family)